VRQETPSGEHDRRRDSDPFLLIALKVQAAVCVVHACICSGYVVMMRDFSFVFLFLLLSLIGFATAEEALVASDRIKVFLFAAPAFHAEVGVDLKNNTCLSLDNNL
jgi:hypothetical protein